MRVRVRVRPPRLVPRVSVGKLELEIGPRRHAWQRRACRSLLRIKVRVGVGVGVGVGAGFGFGFGFGFGLGLGLGFGLGLGLGLGCRSRLGRGAASLTLPGELQQVLLLKRK